MGLFFEEKFQFAAGLSPTFLRRGMVTGSAPRLTKSAVRRNNPTLDQPWLRHYVDEKTCAISNRIRFLISAIRAL